MILLRNADVYAPEPLGVRHLLIAGERVVWLGRDLPPLPPVLGVEEHDLGRRRVIPGLIDGHVHLTGGGGEAGQHTRVPPLALSALTRAGVTTAELVATTRGLNQLGRTAFCYTGGYHVPPVTLTGTVRGDVALVDVILGVGEIAVSDHRSSRCLSRVSAIVARPGFRAPRRLSQRRGPREMSPVARLPLPKNSPA